jgi:hypothetical protein
MKFCSRTCRSRAWYERACVDPQAQARRRQRDTARRKALLDEQLPGQLLADAVLDRRRELGLSQLQVGARMATTDKAASAARVLERVERSKYLVGPYRATLEALDRGLGWAPGSAQALLYDGTPPRPMLDGRPGGG